MDEKCVCHINGFRLKDTEARRKATTAGEMANAAMEKTIGFEKQIAEAVTTANRAKTTADGAVVTAKAAYTTAKAAETTATAAQTAADGATLAAKVAENAANEKVSRKGDTMEGALDMGNHEIANVMNVQTRAVILREPGDGVDVTVEAMTEPGTVRFVCPKRGNRVIVRGVAPGVADTDAVNMAQVLEMVRNGNGSDSGENVNKLDVTKYDLPVLELTGDISPIAVSKDNVVTVEYVYGDRSGTCTVKGQGSGTYAQAQVYGADGKYNYTIEFDNPFEAVEGWGVQSKYCLKGNLIDATSARNVVTAKLWGQIVRSRSVVPEELASLPNCGAIDGFPCIITLNGDFHGLYTWTIPKEGWLFGMGEKETEAILCADYSEACYFREEATLNGDFDLEYVSDEENTGWVIESVNRLINACRNSDGTDLDTTIAQYLDWDSAIDYLIFKYLVHGVDIGGKNYILATYDGVKWLFSAYDLDSTYGLHPDGKIFYSVNSQIVSRSGHTVDNLIWNYKPKQLKARFRELVAGPLSVNNVANMFLNFAGAIRQQVYLADWEKWYCVPNTSANTIQQIIGHYQRTVPRVDALMQKHAGLDTPPDEPENLIDVNSPDFLPGMKLIQGNVSAGEDWLVPTTAAMAVTNYIYFKEGDVFKLEGATALYGETNYSCVAYFANDKTASVSPCQSTYSLEQSGLMSYADKITTLKIDGKNVRRTTGVNQVDGYLRLALKALSGATSLNLSAIKLTRNPNGENADAWA